MYLVDGDGDGLGFMWRREGFPQEFEASLREVDGLTNMNMNCILMITCIMTCH